MKPTILNILESYDYPVFNDLNMVNRNIEWIMKYLPELLDFNDKIQLFFRGSSGLTISMYLADAMTKAGYKDVKLSFIRKENESSHSSNPYPLFGYKIVIVDDFVSSGKTIRTILRYIQETESYDPNSQNYKEWYSKTDMSIITGFICKGISREFEDQFGTLPGLKFIIE